MRWPGLVCAGLWRGRVDPVWCGVVGIMPCSAAAASNHRKVSSSHSCRYAPPPAPAQILHLHKTQEFYTAQRHNTLTSRTQHWGYTALTGTNSCLGAFVVFTARRGRTCRNAVISLLILLSSAPVTCLEGRPKWSSASCGR